MKIGPKYKICKRLGSGIFEKCQTQKFMLSEARKSKMRKRGGRPRTLSDYGRQLLEKQKVRFTYGITERQLVRYVKEAMNTKGADPASLLFSRLETRLDNMVYRFGLVPTRAFARQMVSHGHITVGNRKVTIPSYRISTGDVIGIRAGSRPKALFATIEERLAEHISPVWVIFNAKTMEGSLAGTPSTEENLPFDLRAVLEFYSR